MKHKKLGNTDESISVIGQGTMGIGGHFTADESDDAANIKALQYGLEFGMSFIDTAEVYGGGHTEELVGKAFKNKRKDIFLATKVSPENLRGTDLINAAERSLKRLNTDYIDLYQIHWSNYSIAIQETAAALNLLVKQGKVRHIGVSNFSAPELSNLMMLCNVVSAQSEYNIFDRTVEYDLLSFCQRNNITFIAYSPLDKGKSNPILDKIAKKYNKQPSQVALSWMISKENVVAIPKAKNHDHIKANSELFDIQEEDLSLIESHKSKLLYICPSEVECDSNGLDKFVPNHKVLGESFKIGIPMKPIRIDKDYKLVEGKVRYWAWKHAFGDSPCPALLRE